MSFPTHRTWQSAGTTQKRYGQLPLSNAHRLAATGSGVVLLTTILSSKTVVCLTLTARLSTLTLCCLQNGGCTSDPPLLFPPHHPWGRATVSSTLQQWLTPSTMSVAMMELVAPTTLHACARKSALSSGSRSNITAASGANRNQKWPQSLPALVHNAKSPRTEGMIRRHQLQHQRRPTGDAATVTTTRGSEI